MKKKCMIKNRIIKRENIQNKSNNKQCIYIKCEYTDSFEAWARKVMLYLKGLICISGS